MIPMRRTAGLFAVIIVGCATMVAAAQPVMTDEAYARLNRAVIDGQLVPAHRAFAAATDDLADAMRSYCADGTGDMGSVVQAFHVAYDRWMAIGWVNFGPESLFMRPIRVHFWPDSRNSVGRQLAALLQAPRPDLLDPETLASASVALQGLPALERLLFGDVVLVEDRYACRLATSIAANLQTIASDLSQGWSYPDELALALPQDQALAVTMYQAVYEQLELILARKLTPPLGDSVEAARPRMAESWRSERALRNITASLIAIRGIVENGDDVGFADRLRDDIASAPLADLLVDELDAAISLSQTLQGWPIDQLVTDTNLRAELIALGDHINEARHAWADEVGPALGLNLGFNSLDGD